MVSVFPSVFWLKNVILQGAQLSSPLCRIGYLHLFPIVVVHLVGISSSLVSSRRFTSVPITGTDFVTTLTIKMMGVHYGSSKTLLILFRHLEFVSDVTCKAGIIPSNRSFFFHFTSKNRSYLLMSQQQQKRTLKKRSSDKSFWSPWRMVIIMHMKMAMS